MLSVLNFGIVSRDIFATITVNFTYKRFKKIATAKDFAVNIEARAAGQVRANR